jgi:hypothetical protein
MIWLAATAAYTILALLTARWFYRVNAQGGNIDTNSIDDIMISCALVLVIGAFWPLVFAYLGAVRFIATPRKETPGD